MLEEAKQKHYSLNFNKVATTLDREPMYELAPGTKGKTMNELKDTDYIEVTLNKFLARQIANSSEDFGGKEFTWYGVLYNEGKLILDEVDTKVLYSFIKGRRKGDNPISNIIACQLFDVFKTAQFTE